MSTPKYLKKALKRGTKALRKVKNPLDKSNKVGLESFEILHRVVSGNLKQTQAEVERLVDLTERRMEEARKAKKLKEVLKTQLKQNPKEIRKVFEFGRKTMDSVADGMVDVMDAASNGFDAYERDREAEKANRKSIKAVKKGSAVRKAA